MLKPQLHHSNSTQIPFLLHKPFIHGSGNASFPISMHSFRTKNKQNVRVVRFSNSSNIKAVESSTEKSVSVKAVVTVKRTVTGFFSNLGIERVLDDVKDLLDKTLLLELVHTELDPKTGLEKETIKGYAHRTSQEKDVVKYESTFEVPIDFGEVGAILVENEHHTEMYLQDIVLDGFANGPVHVNCNSWVHSKYDNPQKRVFFSNKSYLPSETPSGLLRLREEELEILRGNGQGERKSFERVYDYDVYNDIGDPDSNIDLKRPVLGGKEHPYPRRCRTGRPRSSTDPLSETRSSNVYVPRDENFSEIKEFTFSLKTISSVIPALLPSLETAIIDADLGFPYFTAIDSLFNEGINLPSPKTLNVSQGFFTSLLPRLFKAIDDTQDNLLKFETPETMDRDKFFWFRDEEFARQTLSGLNPYSIQLVTEWPLKSKLDPKIYGPPESAITTEMIEREIKGFMTVQEAIKQKKLFILDYHDLLLPYVSKVRQIEGTTLYGSRTLFFLTLEGTLRPLAIELTRPPIDGKPQWKDVYTPCWDATGVWLWRLAKAHVLAHDSGYHQLVSHWLRTHCATEPYIIATNRQLSEMHPIYRLLHPHFRYTMDINGLARLALINAGGIIETSFSPGKYSMEFSSVAYDKQWQFNLQALPADLISRGMAVEDPNAPHGLKLTIEDYPFANDGLLLWDAIKETNMPAEEPSKEFWDNFLKKPEGALLQCFPSKIQATKVMAILDVLSNHSPDEEYLGEKIEKAWDENPIIKAAFEKFNGRLKDLEGTIDERNANRDFKNRCGAGVVPYELLKPFSEPGVTGKGVPYSISI
ncbi:linoleate 13S-lipoxygenase 2-1, chloroplastic-like isoform X5 [Fagus crenata]